MHCSEKPTSVITFILSELSPIFQSTIAQCMHLYIHHLSCIQLEIKTQLFSFLALKTLIQSINFCLFCTHKKYNVIICLQKSIYPYIYIYIHKANSKIILIIITFFVFVWAYKNKRWKGWVFYCTENSKLINNTE